MELNEITYTERDVLEAAERVLDQAIIQKSGDNVCEELGFGFASEMRMYVADDRSCLASVVHKFTRGEKTYFLGGLAKK